MKTTVRIVLVLLLTVVGAHPAAAVSVVEVKSPAGLTAYLAENQATSVVSISFSFSGGAAFDPADKQGLSALGASLMNEGAGDLDSYAFQSAMADLAISIQAGASRDVISGDITATKATLDDAVRLARLAFNEPRFDEEALERMRRVLLVNLASRAEVPGRLAIQHLFSDLYGDHPYARDDGGTPETVAALTRKDVKIWAKTRFARDRLLIGVAGAVTPAQTVKIIDEIYAGLPAKSPVTPVLPQATVSATSRTSHVVRDLTQSTIMIGAPGIGRDDPDWYAAVIADYIFGGGSFASRLMTEVREKRGLTYGVSSRLAAYDYGPILIVSASTRADQAARSLAVIREEWAKMADPGPTAEELEGAKLYLTGAWPLRFTSTGNIADLLVQVQHDNLGLDYLDRRNGLISAVTLADVRRVAKRLYRPDQLSIVIVGPREPAFGQEGVSTK